jgi:hypothetical protein
MSESSSGLPPELALRVENTCRRFEHAWQAGQNPQLIRQRTVAT